MVLKFCTFVSTILPIMLPNLPDYYATLRRWSGLLLMFLSLPVASVRGQTLAPEAPRNIQAQLAVPLADTARVGLLLELSKQAVKHVDRSTARDSALRFSKDALTLSTQIGYDSGIYKASLAEMSLWVNMNEWQVDHEQDGTQALENARRMQATIIAFARAHGSAEELGEAYVDVAETYEQGTNYSKDVLPLYDSAATCFRRSGRAVRESYALYCVALHYAGVGKTKESIPIYHRSVALAEPTGGTQLYMIYGMLGRAYHTIGGCTIALRYQLKALQLAEAAGDTTDEMGAIHLFLGLTYASLKNYALARTHFEKAYSIDRHYTDGHGSEFLAAAMNLADMLAMTDPQEAIAFTTRFREEYKTLLTPQRRLMTSFQLMSAYAKQHDYSTAQTYCDEILAAIDKAPGLLFAHQRIGAFLVSSGQYSAAEKHLVEAEPLAKAQGKMPYLKTIYGDWYKIDSAKGKPAMALEKYKLYKAYGDSILNETKTQEIALLEVEYETAKKEQSIALLTKKSEIDRQLLAQSRFQKNAVLTGLVVAVLFLGLVFNQYRIKKRNNLELTRRQQEIETTNRLLQKTILEKEWLLKEVHHRVKNNLQTVVSLLGSQSYALQNSEVASAILDSQNRVYAMSLIHQKLYQTEHRTSINMASYLHELTDYLRDSFPAGQKIQFQLDIEPIELDVSQAIPIGLILNEAITNAIKYAFDAVPKEGSRVTVTMHQHDERNVRLTIADNGRGLPPDFDCTGGNFGMGLRLMQGLMEEIDGTFIISNSNTGVTIEVGFGARVLLD
jgi:two-component system, sensor histidine kinase PdtaS